MDQSSTKLKQPKFPVRVLHVFRKLDIGGAELRMLDIARQMDPSQFELHICVFSEEPGELSHELAALGAKFHQTRLGPRFPRYFKQLLRSEKIDVVHPHMHYSAGLVLRLAAQVGTAGRIAHFQSCSDGQGDGLRQGRLAGTGKILQQHMTAAGHGSKNDTQGLRLAADNRLYVSGDAVDCFSGPSARLVIHISPSLA